MAKVSEEEIILELIVNGGNARSKAMEAIQFAKKGEFENAKKRLEESSEALNQAHIFQTELIQSQLQGEKMEISLMMVHGQDHLMNSITVRDLAEEMIELYRRIYEKEEKL